MYFQNVVLPHDPVPKTTLTGRTAHEFNTSAVGCKPFVPLD
jgi:hypothetical protein